MYVEGVWKKDEFPKIYNDRAPQKRAPLQVEYNKELK